MQRPASPTPHSPSSTRPEHDSPLTVDPKQFVQQLHLLSPRVKAHPRRLHKAKRRSPVPLSSTDEPLPVGKPNEVRSFD